MNEVKKTDKILITGAYGFLGRRLCRHLENQGYTNLIRLDSNTDLRNRDTAYYQVVRANPDHVISLAANVGGIGYNQKYPANLGYDNIMIGVNTIHACYQHNIPGRLIFISTICGYPENTPVPFEESWIGNGLPEPTNAIYGLAKNFGHFLFNSYRQQYGLKGCTLYLVNLMGPGDDFSEKGHVVPALVKRIVDAHKAKVPEITVWGDGECSREFLFADEAARAIQLGLEKYDGPLPINIGSGEEIKIKELVEKIVKIVNYKGKIIWDHSKPNGQQRRCLDVSRAEELLGFRNQTSLEDSLHSVIAHYKAFYTKKK